MSWSKRLIVASLALWSVGTGSTLVQFHPAAQRGLHAYGCVDPFQVAILDVLLDLGAQFHKRLLFGRALARRVGLGANAGDDLARLLQDCIAVQVVKVPAGGAGCFRELAGFLVEGWQRVAEKD